MLLATVGLLAAASAGSDDVATIIVDYTPASVAIDPLPDGQRTVDLPALEYALVIRPSCAATMQPESVSISIADTRKTLRRDALDGKSRLQIDFLVPGEQVSPLAVDGFCRANEETERTVMELRVAGAVTAHVSLRCVNDDSQSMIYVSEALAVSLRCDDSQASSSSAAPVR